MKGKAKGGAMPYQSSTAPVVKDAEKNEKKGGAVKKAAGGSVGKKFGGAMEGKMAAPRADRRARGGATGSPFSMAHKETAAAKGSSGKGSTNSSDD